MFKIRKTKKKSSASGDQSSPIRGTPRGSMTILKSCESSLLTEWLSSHQAVSGRTAYFRGLVSSQIVLCISVRQNLFAPPSHTVH